MLKDLLERNTNKKLFRSWIKGLIPVILLIITSSCAKANNPDSLFKIADDVVEQCRFDLPDTNIVPELSEYNLWMYANFMIMEGMDALGEVSGNEQYKTYTARNIDFFADLQSKYGDSLKGGAKRAWYAQPSQMWHCGMIAAFPERQQSNPKEEFIHGMAIFDAYLEHAPKFNDGTLVRKKGKLGLGVQIDDLYMIVPYWCRKMELLNDSTWLDRAIEEALRYPEYLWDENDHLMHCLWLEQNKEPYNIYWGRGNAWYIMAITDLLSFIPENHPKRKEVLEDYYNFIQGIVPMQDENGLWHQILDRPDSYAETSCSGMFTYCILKGVNEGWLDSSFLEVGKLGWQGLLSKVNDEYKITGVCPPTDMSTDPDYYMKRGPVTHDVHAIGPFLLSGAEYLRANKELKATD